MDKEPILGAGWVELHCAALGNVWVRAAHITHVGSHRDTGAPAVFTTVRDGPWIVSDSIEDLMSDIWEAEMAEKGTTE